MGQYSVVKVGNDNMTIYSAFHGTLLRRCLQCPRHRKRYVMFSKLGAIVAAAIFRALND